MTISLAARTFVELADHLVDDYDIVDLLMELSTTCVKVLDIAAAGIMLISSDGTLRALASSSETMRIVEVFELQSQEGPCVDCYRTGEPVFNQDLGASDVPWPRFAAVALAAGFTATDAIPLRLRHNVIGALNMFRTELGSLDDDDIAIAQGLADVATVAVIQHNQLIQGRDSVHEHLNQAIHARVVIEQAQGIIAEREHLGMDQAFERLRYHARSRHERLADVAASLVDGTCQPAALDSPTTHGVGTGDAT